MTRLFLKRSFLLLPAFLLLFAALTSSGQESTPWSQNTSPLPPPTGFVNDFAGVIDPSTKARLEARLTQFRDSTNPPTELAVAIVRTTGERAIFDYSLAVARGWGIGSKQDDNPSALLFIAIDDRKYFTQVSKDLEDELPDGLVGNLQRQFLVPEFRNGNYAKGVEDTISAYITTIEQRSSGTAPANKAQTPGAGNSGVSSGLLGVFCCAAIVIVVLIIIFGRRGKGPTSSDRDRWGGGPFGGGGRNDSSDFGTAALPWVIGSILSGSGSSSSSDWGSSGGSDWGGFGGGGDFGGGGAGGDW